MTEKAEDRRQIAQGQEHWVSILRSPQKIYFLYMPMSMFSLQKNFIYTYLRRFLSNISIKIFLKGSSTYHMSLPSGIAGVLVAPGAYVQRGHLILEIKV